MVFIFKVLTTVFCGAPVRFEALATKAPQAEDAGLKHLLEETPSKWFLDDQKYCRREVLEENVIDAEMLKRINFFRNFGPVFLDELLNTPESIRKVLVMPGTVLLREGSPGDSMMVISKGRVATSVNGRVVKHLGEGSYFGELVFLGATLLRTVTVTATTFCALTITGRGGVHVALRNPWRLESDNSLSHSFML
ncbi:Potassium/sodium hyperpolarization-activated cyclic nucleotide-gated channel 4 [Durusdinium trenchii]|uniref:Potassium/sodium hyperpolarization-activated cyclic nucleotide-gated channel 4 n=1 Tax=Durusdinium trenchii TaxID=1381693 RepID=A0ABP0HPX8_9DINO